MSNVFDLSDVISSGHLLVHIVMVDVSLLSDVFPLDHFSVHSLLGTRETRYC